jgi:hypothetical protein
MFTKNQNLYLIIYNVCFSGVKESSKTEDCFSQTKMVRTSLFTTPTQSKR